jgi:hypothetical protein
MSFKYKSCARSDVQPPTKRQATDNLNSTKPKPGLTHAPVLPLEILESQSSTAAHTSLELKLKPSPKQEPRTDPSCVHLSEIHSQDIGLWTPQSALFHGASCSFQGAGTSGIEGACSIDDEPFNSKGKPAQHNDNSGTTKQPTLDPPTGINSILCTASALDEISSVDTPSMSEGRPEQLQANTGSIGFSPSPALNPFLPPEIIAQIIAASITEDLMSIYPSDYTSIAYRRRAYKLGENFKTSLALILALLSTSWFFHTETLDCIHKTPLHIYVCDASHSDLDNIRVILGGITTALDRRAVGGLIYEQLQHDPWRLFGEVVVNFAPNLVLGHRETDFWSGPTPKQRQLLTRFFKQNQVSRWERIMKGVYQGGVISGAWFYDRLGDAVVNGRCLVRIVFREADGRIAADSDGVTKGSDRPALPCWQHSMVSHLLNSWRWLGAGEEGEKVKRAPNSGPAASDFVTLPNFTVAVLRSQHPEDLAVKCVKSVVNDIVLEFEKIVYPPMDKYPGPGCFWWLRNTDNDHIFVLIQGLSGGCGKPLVASEMVNPWALVHGLKSCSERMWDKTEEPGVMEELQRLMEDLRTDRVFFGDEEGLANRISLFEDAVDAIERKGRYEPLEVQIRVGLHQ